MAILQQNQKIGTYEVKRLIKENFYCETYRVEDEKEEPFFLKLFILKNTPEKMLDENHKVVCVEYMSKLRHKNLVSFIEQGAYSDEQVGECEYVVTNYFSGELLADKLMREGSMSIEDAVKVMYGILDGLKFMHERNLFHNDITPQNIMLSERTGGIAELIDMSHVSKYIGGSPTFDTSDLDERYQSNITFAGMYNNATDLFSAVSLFYTMLTNRIPWDVEIPEEADRKERIKIVKEARKAPLNLDDLKIEEGYKRILQKGLNINGTCKYADVELLIGDLQNPNRINELEQPREPEQPRQQSSSSNNVVDEEKQATEAKVDIQKGKGNGFKDIAGMDGLKQMLTQKVIFILKDKEKAAKYKLLPPNGMLFYGPPGCGKSFFAEKFAEETGFNFMLVKASDLGSIYVHGSQGKIADLFKKAEESKPTIICFDEFDAFVPNRSNKGAEHQAGEVNEFLSQLNNCAQRGIFVIATSNRPDMIDPAVLRTGRIDKLVYVPMPDKEARQEMFKLHLSGRPCEEIDAERLAELTDGYIASDIAYIVNDAAMGAAFSDQPITQQLLETAINSTHPSIGKEVVESYESLRGKMEDIDQRNKRPKIGFV
ncbi:MAG: AAA family ATPase [Prevotella sp.]|nr:AAA family ATPase [Prevotella sp.]